MIHITNPDFLLIPFVVLMASPPHKSASLFLFPSGGDWLIAPFAPFLPDFLPVLYKR
jgi:hypothetical protein